MKRILTLIIILTTLLSARINETTEELYKRYGDPITEGEGSLMFTIAGLYIVCMIHEDKAAAVSYQKTEKNVKLSKAEIETILNANGNFKPINKTGFKQLYYAGKDITALHDELKGEVIIFNRAEFEKWQEAEKKKTQNKLKGL